MINHKMKTHGKRSPRKPSNTALPRGLRATPPLAAENGEDRPASKFVDAYFPYMMMHAAYVISGQFQEYLTKRGVRASVWRLLVTLLGTEGLTIGQLSTELLLQQPTVTRLVDRMERGRLISRTASTRDRRKVIITLTTKGRTLAASLAKKALQHQDAALSQYSKAERDKLLDLLRSVLSRQNKPTQKTIQQRLALDI